jgi:hypothetical protein
MTNVLSAQDERKRVRRLNKEEKKKVAAKRAEEMKQLKAIQKEKLKAERKEAAKKRRKQRAKERRDARENRAEVVVVDEGDGEALLVPRSKRRARRAALKKLPASVEAHHFSPACLHTSTHGGSADDVADRVVALNETFADKGLVVKKPSMAGADQYGLFATRAFTNQEQIACYCGEVVCAPPRGETLPGNRYVLSSTFLSIVVSCQNN